MLFISEVMAFLLSLSVSSSVILSFVPTYCNQLSTQKTDQRQEVRGQRRMRKVFYKMVIANTFILSFALTKWYQLSPICAADGPPFLSKKELRIASFPCVSLSILNFYKRIFLFTPAICKDCTVPRIRSGFLLSKDKVLSLLATSLLNRNPYGFPINGSPVF